MFNYQERDKEYLELRLVKIKNENDQLFERLKYFIGSIGKCSVTNLLAKKMTESINRCINEIYEKTNSTIQMVANLRFLFETCISIRLLNKEPTYKYKLRYSIYQHQIDKSEALKKYADFDKKKLDELHKKEESIQQYAKKSDFTPDKIYEKLTQVDSLYDELDREISLFLDMAESTGAEFQKIMIDKYLKVLQENDDMITKEWERVKEELLKDDEVNKIFDFRKQKSRVEKELKDIRTWKKKAEDVNLSEMYEFIYNYTSAIIHSTSYSILIPNQLDNAEITMISRLATRLVNDSLRGLCIFASIPNFTIIHLEES